MRRPYWPPLTVPFYHFWDPRSGLPGGIICALIMWGVYVGLTVN